MVFVSFDFYFSVVERESIAVFAYSITDRLGKVEAIAMTSGRSLTIVSSNGADEFALFDDGLGDGL
jgi:hypothetical protein